MNHTQEAGYDIALIQSVEEWFAAKPNEAGDKSEYNVVNKPKPKTFKCNFHGKITIRADASETAAIIAAAKVS